VKYLPPLANKMSRGFLFVAINGASRRVFIAMYRHKTAANVQRFLSDLERTGPIRIRTILTEKAFTDRLFGVRRRAVTRQRAFETLCSTLGIEFRLAHQDRHKPTAWLSGSKAAARTCYKVTMFDQVKIWG